MDFMLNKYLYLFNCFAVYVFKTFVYFTNIYRVSSKTVPTWLFALLSASTHTNCKGLDIFEKFRKFAT